jgi:hypothetical protein
VDTANCRVVQTYNVDNQQVPGDSGDYNYTGSHEGIATLRRSLSRSAHIKCSRLHAL